MTAQRTTRVRGFAPWRPQAKTAEMLRAVRAVLAEYRAYLPMTIRQVYYRLIGRGIIDKDPAAVTASANCSTALAAQKKFHSTQYAMTACRSMASTTTLGR